MLLFFSASKGTSCDRNGSGGGMVGDGDQAKGGKSFVNGGQGGSHSDKTYGGDGGFGGGGGAFHEGGGGGGYTGGSGVPQSQYNTSYPQYGAGSFNAGKNQSSSVSTASPQGKVVVTLL